ncbi:MAG: hypothetical protein SWO11_15505 [Thermodesulfobacteriota bacterium]|nr:hypothetical protein [Thermodesulfobacteriota bacterium]
MRNPKGNWKHHPSDIPIKESYGLEDLKDLYCEKGIGTPGKYPFTRGLLANMCRG